MVSRSCSSSTRTARRSVRLPSTSAMRPRQGWPECATALLVTGPRGLLRYSVTTLVPDRAAEIGCTLLTPVLHSPDREDERRWLRIEATANLPDGASLEIRYAATSDAEVRDRLVSDGRRSTATARYRVTKLLREPGLWRAPIVFHGGKPSSDAAPAAAAATFSAPLFDVHEPYVWVCITLRATAGGSLPSLSRARSALSGRQPHGEPAGDLSARGSAAGQLPALARRRARIHDAGARCAHRARSRVTCIPTLRRRPVARLHRALAGIAVGRRARARNRSGASSLARPTLREAVARARDSKRCSNACCRERRRDSAIIDCDCGLRLRDGRRRRVPRQRAAGASSAGRTQWSPELGATAVLGRMRLPCAGQTDDGVRQIAGLVRVDIAASGEERRAWEPWLRDAHQRNGATHRPSAVALGEPAGRCVARRLVGSFVLSAAPTPHLGSDAVTGVARLPERGSRITSTGADIGTRLQ